MSFYGAFFFCLMFGLTEQTQYTGSELAFLYSSGTIQLRPRKLHTGRYIRKRQASFQRGGGGHKHSQRRDLVDFVQAAETACQNHSNVAALALNPQWEAYQLVDALKDHGDDAAGRWIGLCGGKDSQQQEIKGTLPDSLACRYHTRKAASGNNETIATRLLQVIKERPVILENKNINTVMVHIRLGDVIDRANHSVADMLTKQTYYYDTDQGQAWNAYVKPLSHFEQIAKQIAAGSNVELLAGAHDPDHKGNLTKSCIYLHSVSSFFSSLHFPTTLRVGHDPDSDITCAVQSSSFAPAGGGFSELISEMVALNGGSVLRTDFTSKPLVSAVVVSDATEDSLSPPWKAWLGSDFPFRLFD